MDIRLEENGSKGRFVVALDSHDEEAELTFSRASDSLVIVDHTFVPDSMRGMGVGKALAQRVVEEGRAKGFRIIPLCPFFKAQAARHPDWSDVVQG
ncbi:GNAT family N-acetyltransferase [Aurantiacibacter odishensis]|uniref:GNAT family N-acetyltransferase n=1 Tax=Aurantiacibacter odishensis TaxID=1155476 RepID=UPI000E74A345|nr:GNAT family N-acetyltransferase [Aurantiacibacter odishensis]